TSTNNEVFLVKLPNQSDLSSAKVPNQPGTSSRAEFSPPQVGETQSRDLHFVPRKISTSPGSDSTPRYSPDGKYIAYLSQARAGYESDRFRLMLYERATGKITELTKGFDRWVGSFVWTPDSEAIYFSAEDKGQSPVFAVDLVGRVVPEFHGHYDDLSITPNGTIAMSGMSISYPNELFIFDQFVGCTEK